MNYKVRLISLFILLLLVFSNKIYSQSFTKNSIKTGLGFGVHTSGNTDGLGIVYCFGYQREIWKDRLRFNPNLTIGQYGAKVLPTDARDQYFSSMNLETNFYFDLFKAGGFSLVLGSGLIINNTRGLIGTGGWQEDNYQPQNTEYFSDYCLGVNLAFGLRINPAKKRIAVNIMPLNLRLGTNGFMEQFARIEFDIKL
jgi:hypothetical protein